VVDCAAGEKERVSVLHCRVVEEPEIRDQAQVEAIVVCGRLDLKSVNVLIDSFEDAAWSTTPILRFGASLRWLGGPECLTTTNFPRCTPRYKVC